MPMSGSYFYPGVSSAVSSYTKLAFASASVPAAISSVGLLYRKSSDDLLYYKTPGGVEYSLTASGSIEVLVLSSSLNSITTVSSSLDFVSTDKSYHIRAKNSHLILSSSAGSTVAVSGALSVDGEIYGYKAFMNAAGASYNLLATDAGKVIELSSAVGIAATGFLYLPNFLSAGFCCTVSQISTGTFTFSASAGAVLRSFHNLTKSADVNALCSLYVTSNSNGASAVYILRRQHRLMFGLPGGGLGSGKSLIGSAFSNGFSTYFDGTNDFIDLGTPSVLTYNLATERNDNDCLD